ncbi:hypothetical protein [Dysgonomonas sp. 25]|uniref:hypothetical protein n=1 Tax=Dysgonomonas sp. 25 TaxID=2302933 RepID=UPI0013D89790|nr:hypothetical protein [Dysgonomonas sp. 25]
MKRTEKKNNENNISYLTRSIKLGFRVAFVALCVWFVSKIGVSVVSVVGIYIIVHSVLKIIRLSIHVVFYLLFILFLVAIVMGIIVFIL